MAIFQSNAESCYLNQLLVAFVAELASPLSFRLVVVAQSCVAGRRAWPRACWEEEGIAVFLFSADQA
jgi:hypothetical protein